jgi:membrane protein YdbS with pleckstrin-like domain
MNRDARQASAWVYRGIWGVLTRWFRVPFGPPPPAGPVDKDSRSFRPSNGFLRYLKLKCWLVLAVVDAAVFAGWMALFVARPRIGLWLLPVAVTLAVVPGILAYVAIHLRYDTTWYVFTSRSLRIRRGIWIIHETTITFENIQNVLVNSGPIERYLGIANVTVDTAGGGGSGKDEKGHKTTNYHQGLIEGIDNADEIRTHILTRVRHSHSAGLGDEHRTNAGWSPAQVALLREIRDLL